MLWRAAGFYVGPIVFLIYINDLLQGSKFCTRLFADDTVLTLSNNCERELNFVKLEIVKIDHWMKINKLSLNHTKIKFMLFRHKLKRMPILYQHQIAIGEHKLEQVDQIKYLGVIFDKKTLLENSY